MQQKINFNKRHYLPKLNINCYFIYFYGFSILCSSVIPFLLSINTAYMLIYNDKLFKIYFGGSICTHFYSIKKFGGSKCICLCSIKKFFYLFHGLHLNWHKVCIWGKLNLSQLIIQPLTNKYYVFEEKTLCLRFRVKMPLQKILSLE